MPAIDDCNTNPENMPKCNGSPCVVHTEIKDSVTYSVEISAVCDTISLAYPTLSRLRECVRQRVAPHRGAWIIEAMIQCECQLTTEYAVCHRQE